MKRLRALALFSVVFALAAHFGIFYILGIRAPANITPVKQQFEVHYLNSSATSPDPVTVQQSVLLDSAPLFMPTRWNMGSEMSEVASLQQATEVFRSFPPDLDLPEASPVCPWNPQSSEELALPALAGDPRLLLSRFGRMPYTRPETPHAASSVSAMRLDGNRGIYSTAVSLPSPVNQQAPLALWNPVRFYLHIAGDVPVGAPLLVQSSGFTEWDQVLQSYVGSLDFYRSIESGYYRISVFP